MKKFTTVIEGTIELEIEYTIEDNVYGNYVDLHSVKHAGVNIMEIVAEHTLDELERRAQEEEENAPWDHGDYLHDRMKEDGF